MQQAIVLRKKLEPWFASVEADNLAELGIALRIDGSLGSFGPEGVENVVFENGKIECDIVVADQGWAEMSDDDILSVLQQRVLEAVDTCLSTVRIPYDPEALAASVD
jgi:hypothetical protein